MRLRIGYPDLASERQIVRNSETELPQACHPACRPKTCCSSRKRFIA